MVGGLFKAFQIVYTANLDSGDAFRSPLQVPERNRGESRVVCARGPANHQDPVGVHRRAQLEVISLEPPARRRRGRPATGCSGSGDTAAGRRACAPRRSRRPAARDAAGARAGRPG